MKQLLVVMLIWGTWFTQSVWSQDKKSGHLQGTVTTENKTPLIGVDVVLLQTGIGSITNAEGGYKIQNLPEGTYTVQFSYIGFVTQKITVAIKANETVTENISLTEDVTEIDEVTIRGRSKVQTVERQPYTVKAISAKPFYNLSTDVQSVLGRVEGVKIREEGGLGSNSEFSLFGFSGNQIKFFIDGIPMDNYGSSLGLNTIPVTAIERIEVYNGVVPVYLGTDALGGAVNIITKQNNNFLDAAYTIGSFNTHRAEVNGAYTNLKTGFTLRGNFNFNYSDNNYEVLADITDANGNIEDTQWVERFHDRYKSGMAKVEAGFVNKTYADQLLIGLTAAKDENDVQTGATMETVYGAIEQNSESLISTLKYSKADLFTDGLDASFYAAYNVTRTFNLDTLTGVRYNWLGDRIYTGSTEGEQGDRNDETMSDNEVTTQFNLGYQLNDTHTVSFNHAFQYFNRDVNDILNPDKIENQFPRSYYKNNLGLSYTMSPNDKWNATLFGKGYFLKVETSKQYNFGTGDSRIDAYENSQNSFGYGLATTYFILKNLQIKASYEHTYRMPTPEEVFGDNLFVTANPELGPEQSNNFNVNAKWEFEPAEKHYVQLDGSFIYRNASDLIYQRVTVASPQTSYANLAEVRTIGYAGTLNYSFKDWLRLGANVTYQDITDQADFVYNDYSGQQPNFQKGFRIPNIPYLFGNLNAGLQFNDVFTKDSNLSVNYFFNYIKEYYLSWAEYGSKDTKKIIPEQSSHDLAVSYSLKNGKYNISLECKNFTDQMLFDQYKLQKPGRAFYLKLRYAL
ncbi:TonB-dependent receptor [Pseudotamlana agarivorans]|uniref:TonB-dependent receptor n=1 Tax=Pseudotamlana agarivorans TaxID=481183 RepID=UPI0009FF366A|nr:TonB-dependent receptor [Tamlana agarivorans]